MIKGKFYPLTAEELIKLCSVLTDAELKTLLYLKALHPFTDSYKELDTSLLAEHLNISRRSVQRFLKKFKDLNLIEYEVTSFKYKATARASLYDNANLAILGSPPRQQDRQSDPRIADATAGSPARQQDRQLSQNPASKADSSPSQTIQTIQIPQTRGGENNCFLNTEEPVKDNQLEQTYSTNEEHQENGLKKLDLSEVLTSARVVQQPTNIIQREEPSPKISHSKKQEPIPQDLIDKLQELRIPLDEEVRNAIANHHISQAYGAAAHVAETWGTIAKPKSVFIYQLPKQPIRKEPPPLSEEFLEWYKWAIADGLVVDYPAEFLLRDSHHQPKVKLAFDPYWQESWEKIRDNPEDYREPPKINFKPLLELIGGKR